METRRREIRLSLILIGPDSLSNENYKILGVYTFHIEIGLAAISIPSFLFHFFLNLKMSLSDQTTPAKVHSFFLAYLSAPLSLCPLLTPSSKNKSAVQWYISKPAALFSMPAPFVARPLSGLRYSVFKNGTVLSLTIHLSDFLSASPLVDKRKPSDEQI